jgi:hypothetical protein
MRYLLDELTAYEEGFSDILLLDRASERHETFMGTQRSAATVSHTDLQVFRESLLQQLQDLLPTLSPVPFIDGSQIQCESTAVGIRCNLIGHFRLTMLLATTATNLLCSTRSCQPSERC